MYKVAFAFLATLAASGPALAHTGWQHVAFTRDGYDYAFYVKQAARGEHIVGRNLTTGDAFDLDVAGGRVDGVYGIGHVSFGLPEASTTEQTAAR